MKIKLLTGIVHHGSVYPRDYELDVDVDTARALVEGGQAVALETLPPRKKTKWELAQEKAAENAEPNQAA